MRGWMQSFGKYLISYNSLGDVIFTITHGTGKTNLYIICPWTYLGEKWIVYRDLSTILYMVLQLTIKIWLNERWQKYMFISF